MPNVTPLRPDDRRRVGRYRFVGRIEDTVAAPGEDRSGVFLAKMVDGDTVVVTMLGAGRAADPAAKDRFTAEARAARRVAPFCAARIRDAGIEGSEPFLVTEFVPGPSLAEVVAGEGALPPAILNALAIGAATGLTAIHQAGLVHGRLSPDHVLLSPDGPRLVDFSITPPYGAATPAADLLAWAQTILFAAVGRPPVGPQDLAALPEEMRELAAACLTPDPAGRPAARAVLAELLGRHETSAGLLAEGSKQAAAAGRTPLSPTPQTPGRSPRPARSRAIGWGLACGACVLAIAAGTFYITRPHTGSAQAGATDTFARHSPRPRPSPSVSLPAAFTGTWSGTVHQTNPELTVTVRILLSARKDASTIAYPALNCAGTLSPVSYRGGKLTLHQVIDTGRKNCDNGVITLTPKPGSKLAFTFLRPGGDSPAGTLARAGKR